MYMKRDVYRAMIERSNFRNYLSQYVNPSITRPNFETSRFGSLSTRTKRLRFSFHPIPNRDHSRFSPRVSCQDNRIPRVTTRPNRAPFRSLPFPRSVAWNRGDAKKEFPFKTIPRVSRAVHSRQIFTDFLHFHLIPPRWSRRNNGRPNYFFSLSAYCGGSDFWETILPFITRIFY